MSEHCFKVQANAPRGTYIHKGASCASVFGTRYRGQQRGVRCYRKVLKNIYASGQDCLSAWCCASVQDCRSAWCSENWWGGGLWGGGQEKEWMGCFLDKLKPSASTSTSGRLQPRTRRNGAGRRNKGRNVSWRNGSLQRKSGLDCGMQ